MDDQIGEQNTVSGNGNISGVGVDTNNVNTNSTLNIDNAPPFRISDDVIDLPERINLEDTVAHTAVPILDNSFVNRTNQSVIINDFDNLDLSGAPGRILVGVGVVGAVAAGEGLAEGIREARDAAQNIYGNQNKEDQANASIPKK